jgi:hypothetical protein
MTDWMEQNIDVVVLAPHPSDQIQSLRFSASKLKHFSNPMSLEIVRVLGAWFTTSITHDEAQAFLYAPLILKER